MDETTARPPTPWSSALITTIRAAMQAMPAPAHREALAVAADWQAVSATVHNGTAEVIDATGEVRTVTAKCDCAEAATADGHWCRHRLAYALAKRTTEALVPSSPLQAVLGGPLDKRVPPVLPQDDLASVPPHLVMQFKFQGQEQTHLLYDGLLWLAQRRRGGLVSLSATFTAVTAELALATATATFADGSCWTEAADATPDNVKSPAVKPHFPRMALTRAKARALRDALSVGTCAVEEL